jgi:hypothetical protein
MAHIDGAPGMMRMRATVSVHCGLRARLCEVRYIRMRTE